MHHERDAQINIALNRIELKQQANLNNTQRY